MVFKVHSADQQFVWLSTINDFYNYKDMVSHSDPLEIVSYPLNPEEVDFEEKTPVTLGKFKSKKANINENLEVRTLPPLSDITNLKVCCYSNV